VAFVLLSMVSNAFIPQNMGGYLGNLPNPYASAGARPLLAAMQILAMACGLSAAASLVVRWRRAGRVERQQLKWFLAVLPIGLASEVAYAISPGPISLALGALAGGLWPVAIGVAVLQYRLYDIDILLNRAVLYVSLSAVVAAVYLAIVAVARGLFGVERSLAVQVLATVLAAAALWPLRDRVQRWVDRLFFGDRGAPYEALTRLGRRVEEAADAGSALESVVSTVADSLRLPYAAVELRLGSGWTPAATCGRATPEVAAFPLISQRETVGRLLVGQRAPGEQLGPDDERLLADLARQAGPAAHAVALRKELDASRARRVTAREEERRRLRRDLHDGLGPTLAGLTLGLDTARAQAAGQDELQDLLGRLKTETQRAVADGCYACRDGVGWTEAWIQSLPGVPARDGGDRQRDTATSAPPHVAVSPGRKRTRHGPLPTRAAGHDLQGVASAASAAGTIAQGEALPSNEGPQGFSFVVRRITACCQVVRPRDRLQVAGPALAHDPPKERRAVPLAAPQAAPPPAFLRT
jgi:signal transduction histidine kinase